MSAERNTDGMLDNTSSNAISDNKENNLLNSDDKALEVKNKENYKHISFNEENGVHRYAILIDMNEINAKVEGAISNAALTYKHPGFRKGKVPHSIIYQNIGDSIMNEMIQKEIVTVANKIINQEKIDVSMKMDIISSENKDNILEITMEIPSFPVVDLDKVPFSEHSFAVPTIDFGEDQLNGVLNYLATMAVERKQADPDAEVMEYDVVDTSLEVYDKSTNDKIPLNENEIASVIIDDMHIYGGAKQLIGAKVGDTVNIEVKIDDLEVYGPLRSKDINVQCKIFGIKRAEDNDWSKALRKYFSLETDSEVREKIRSMVADMLITRMEDMTLRNIKESLKSFASSLNVRKEMVDYEADRIVDSLMSGFNSKDQEKFAEFMRKIVDDQGFSEFHVILKSLTNSILKGKEGHKYEGIDIAALRDKFALDDFISENAKKAHLITEEDCKKLKNSKITKDLNFNDLVGIDYLARNLRREDQVLDFDNFILSEFGSNNSPSIDRIRELINVKDNEINNIDTKANSGKGDHECTDENHDHDHGLCLHGDVDK